MTNNPTREEWQRAAVLLLHRKYGWTFEQATSYASCITSGYFDDPEYTNESGEIISPEEAIDLDREYWEY